jgi:hypothetical protein
MCLHPVYPLSSFEVDLRQTGRNDCSSQGRAGNWHGRFSMHSTLSMYSQSLFSLVVSGGPMALMGRLSRAPPPPPAMARIVEYIMASMRDGKGLGDMGVIEDIKVNCFCARFQKKCPSHLSPKSNQDRSTQRSMHSWLAAVSPEVRPLFGDFLCSQSRLASEALTNRSWTPSSTDAMITCNMAHHCANSF